MESEEEWLKINPLAKPCWIVKGFIASLILPLIFLWAIFIQIGFIVIFYYIAIIFILNIIIVIWALLFYDRYLYRIGEKTVEIKRGILWKREVIIPYERIQHVSSTRGPIEQLFNLNIINIFTAGTASIPSGFGGSFGAFAAEGYIPGITDPKKIEKTIISRVKQSKSGSGLGDKQEKHILKRDLPQSRDDEILNELKMIRRLLEKNQK